MKVLTSTAVVGGLLLLMVPLFALAQTYQYVDTTGNLRIVVANTPSEAIAIAPNRDAHSGVIEVGVGGEGNALAPTTVPLSAFAKTYQYVDTAGNLRLVVANSPSEAIATAENRMSNSGVMLVAE